MESTPTPQATKNFWHVMKIIATVAFFGREIYCHSYGMFDAFVAGTFVYAVWLTVERKSK